MSWPTALSTARRTCPTCRTGTRARTPSLPTNVDNHRRRERGGDQPGGDQYDGHRRDAGHQQERPDQQRAHHSRRDLPVVADDEVVREAPDGPDDAHAPTFSRARTFGSTVTRIRDSTSQPARTTGSARSPPGHSRLRPPCSTPSPSTDQHVPYVARSRPTAYLSVSPGTADSGRLATTPATVTTSPATSAEAAATGTLPALSPKVITMKTTSTPSRNTPLKDTTKPNQSRPNRRCSPAPRAASVCSRYSCVSSCRALSPALRRIALRSHWRPKISSSTPTTSWSADRGSHVASA